MSVFSIFQSKTETELTSAYARASLAVEPPPVPAEDLAQLVLCEVENPIPSLRIAGVLIPFGVASLACSVEQIRNIVHEGRAGRVDGWGQSVFLRLLKPNGAPGPSLTGDKRDPVRRKHMQDALLLRRAEQIRTTRESASFLESRKRAEEAATKLRAEQARRETEEHRAAKQRALDDARALLAEHDGWTS